jgi:hypothetical protein
LTIRVTVVECVRAPEVPVTVMVYVTAGGVMGAVQQPCSVTATANTIIMQARRTACLFTEALRDSASKNSVMPGSNQTAGCGNDRTLATCARFIWPPGPDAIEADEVEEILMTEVAAAVVNVSEAGVKPQV